MELTKEIIITFLDKTNVPNYNYYKNFDFSKYNSKNIIEEMYKIYFDLKEIPKCKICNKELKFVNFKIGYQEFCSKKCYYKENADKKKSSFKTYKKYRIEEKSIEYFIKKNKPINVKELIIPEEFNFVKSPTEYLYCYVHDIKHNPCCVNCNKEVPFLSFQKGYQRCCSSKCSGKLEDVLNKRKNTNLKKYGVDIVSKLDINTKKAKETKKLKYGNENYNNQEKNKETNLKLYGVENVFSSDLIKNKIKERNLELYGMDSHTQNHFKNKNNLNKIFIENKFVINNELHIIKLSKYFNMSLSCCHKLIKKLKLDCFNIKSEKAQTQKQVFNFIKSNNINNLNLFFNNKKIIENNNKKLELDIFIEIPNQQSIAIEYNGVMYHSFGKSKISKFDNFITEPENKKNHLLKTNLCENKNIKLFHIFENEWLDPVKKEIWKSMIKNSLLLTENKIYARKCNIKELKNRKLVKEFLEKNHIQGNNEYKLAIGLFFQDELVSVATFGEPRYNKFYQYELLRFCSKLNYNIVGSGTRLLNYFKNKFMKSGDKLISYGNRRWTNATNNFYIKNGFKLVNFSDINYYYFHEKNIFKLYHRSTFQKHKLENYFKNKKYFIENFDISLTEKENMYNNGYRRIFDSGQLVYQLVKD